MEWVSFGLLLVAFVFFVGSFVRSARFLDKQYKWFTLAGFFFMTGLFCITLSLKAAGDHAAWSAKETSADLPNSKELRSYNKDMQAAEDYRFVAGSSSIAISALLLFIGVGKFSRREEQLRDTMVKLEGNTVRLVVPVQRGLAFKLFPSFG